MTVPTRRFLLVVTAALVALRGVSTCGATEVPPAGPPAPVSAVPAAPPAPTPGVGRLRGELRSPERQPIPGAQVAASRTEGPPVLILTVSNDDGLVSVDGVPTGVYEARARAAGFLPGTVKELRVGGPFRTVSDFVMKRGLAPQEELVLAPPPGAAGGAASDGSAQQPVTVTVTGERGQPVAGVLVRFQPEGHRADPAQARTGLDGRVTLGPLAPGAWRVLIYRAGWTRLAPPRLRWSGGPLTVIARILPTLERAVPTVDELVPPPRLIRGQLP